MVTYPLTYYNLDTLSQPLAEQLISIAQHEIHCKPSFLITQLHYEGLWGRSEVAQLNNNWGGMTWSPSWSSPHNRDSGVTVTRGTARPPEEGGHYIKYDSVNDFMIDWSYLLRSGGGYNVANTSTFNDAVKGLFIVGGADFDYATMNVEGSQLRYELYLANITARRTEINNDNDGALDVIDNSTPPPDPDPDPQPVPSNLKTFINQLINTVYYFDQKKTFGNNYIMGEKKLDNMFTLQVTNNFIDKLTDFIKNGGGVIPDPTNKPVLPVVEGTPITDIFGPRINPVTGDPDFHNGTDWGGVPNADIYAVMNGVVTTIDYNEFRGNWIMIKHTGDNKYSKYLHLNSTLVSVGDTVSKGQHIAAMGSTGESTGTHLHLTITTTPEGEIDGGIYIDPEIYLGI